jgi:hypothetical protein
VNGREPEGLLARVRQIRRLAAMSGERTAPPTEGSGQDVAPSLEARVAHLEQLLQGFQDSVHRESLRQSKRIADLEGQVQPAAMSKALSEDARERGL